MKSGWVYAAASTVLVVPVLGTSIPRVRNGMSSCCLFITLEDLTRPIRIGLIDVRRCLDGLCDAEHPEKRGRSRTSCNVDESMKHYSRLISVDASP